jgi:hypothetical protein
MANVPEGGAPDGQERVNPNEGPFQNRPITPLTGGGLRGDDMDGRPRRDSTLGVPPGFNVRSQNAEFLEEGTRNRSPPRQEIENPVQGQGQRGAWSPGLEERWAVRPLSNRGGSGVRSPGSRIYIPGATATIRVERSRLVEHFAEAREPDMGKIEGWDSLNEERNAGPGDERLQRSPSRLIRGLGPRYSNYQNENRSSEVGMEGPNEFVPQRDENPNGDKRSPRDV